MKENKVIISTIVCGTPFDIEYNINSDFQGVVEKALDIANVKNKTPQDFVVKLDGKKVELTDKLRDYTFNSNSKIVLDLKTGGGGFNE